jgi:hypothetical protein
LDIHHKKLADFLQLENSLGSLRLDSATDNILYEWDDENSNGRQENAQLSSAEINAFINKYKDLYAQVAQRFGKSDSSGNLTDLSKIKTGEFNRAKTKYTIGRYFSKTSPPQEMMMGVLFDEKNKILIVQPMIRQ